VHKCIFINFFTESGFRIKLHWTTEVQTYNEVTPAGMLHVKFSLFDSSIVASPQANCMQHSQLQASDSTDVAGTKVYTSVRYSLAHPDLRAVRSPQNLYLLVSFSFFLIPFLVLVDSENSDSVLHALFLCSNPLTASDFER